MVGETISHYRIIEKLGEGGMGVVYKAEDTRLGRLVALKFLSSGAATEDAARFLREARAAAALDHPNICTVHEIGEAEGQAYIAMACLEGVTLKQRIAAGPMGLQEILDICAQVADGLGAAHEKGVVHRDIKPSNLMLTPEGRVKIMDFGLAKLAEATRLTKPGSTIGTVAYMSPEQARGEEVDHRSDVWSLGVVLYEMVTGQRPFGGSDSGSALYSIQNDKPAPLASLRPDAPEAFQAVVDCCLAKESEERYETAGKLASALRAIEIREAEQEPAAVPSDAATVSAESPPPSDLPHEIAGYKILECLGEGGMGLVYLAEQQRRVRRRVALKVIKLGMDTKEVIGRFESERQALAMMSHPNIARIFDAGSTEAGRPYFAMEYVPGETITEYCDKHRLSIRERLVLFMDVCRAIHHAHQKAIIHRDIKPSNILVMIQDERPVPKVIDFGVAKATTQHLTERTVFTEFGELVGTPEYMSPEQLEMTGLDVDTTTDVYSLGVLLYELLVGALPFDPETLREAGWDGLRRLIREVDPPRPSTRITEAGERAAEAAVRRHTEIDTLRKLVHGELDWITMRALEKDRTRRYQSASEFGADIERYLNDEPIQASPPSTAYTLKKFVQRHRGPFVAATAIVATVIVLGSIAFWQARIAQRRAVEAQANATLAYATATDDALLKALLLLELADLPETPELFSVAHEAADHPLPLTVLRGHEDMVRHIEFSPDGTRVITTSMDGTARIWRVDGTGEPTVLRGHTNEVWTAAFSPDGAQVATASSDSTVRVWSADGSGNPIVLRHPQWVEGCEFSPDGTQLLTACGDGAARIWNADGTDGPLILRHREGVRYAEVVARFSPDGKLVATVCDGDSTVRIWRADGKGEPVVMPHSEWPWNPSFSPDGTLITYAAGDRTARIRRSDGSGEPIVLQHPLPMGADWSLFSPDGSQILTVDYHGVLRIWEVGDTEPSLVLLGHENALSSVSYSPDGALIITASWDGTARLWQADGKGKPLVLWRHSAEMYDVAFSPDGTLAAVACADGTARVFRIGHTGEKVVFKVPSVWSVEISSDGTRLITGGLDGLVHVLPTHGGDEPRALGRHRDSVFDARFSPDGTLAITASNDSTARIWRIDGSEEPIVLKGHSGGAMSAQFSPDGTQVLTSSVDGTVLLWPASGEGDPRVLCQAGAFPMAEFSPDGTRVLTISRDGVQLWPTDGAGDPVMVAEERDSGSCDFSPDGTQILTARDSGDNTVRMWPADGSGEPLEFRGHLDWVRGGVRFSPDGSRILSSSWDGTARIWPADGRGEPLVVRPGGGWTSSAVFTPDGTRIVTAGASEARIQRVTWPALIEYLRENTHASLTPEQRMKYLAETPSQAWAAYEESERRQGRTPTLKRPD